MSEQPSESSSSEIKKNDPGANASLSGDAIAVKGEPSTVSKLLAFWWLPTSYIVPFLFTCIFCAGHNQEETMGRAALVGNSGLFSAVLVFAMWWLDEKFGARQFYSRSQDDVAKILIFALGFLLWLCWLCSGLAINMSYSQVYSPPVSPVMRVP